MALELPIMPQATAKCRSTDINGDQAAFTRALSEHGERVGEPGQIVPPSAGDPADPGGDPGAAVDSRAQAVHVTFT